MTTRLEYTDMNHLYELLKEIVSVRKEEGYDNFEEISMFIRTKMSKLSLQYLPSPYVHTKCTVLTPHEEQVLKTQTQTQIKINKTQTIDHYMEDILSYSTMLEWAGISFGQGDWFKIRLAMKRLLLDNNCEFVRFYGKVYGIDSDYYVIFGVPKSYPMQNLPKHIESRGNEGINHYTFWVSDSLLETWNELPDITHEQLVISRLFKYIFTGDLTAKVKSFIQFPGKEMHLLKCQLMRIMHASFIVPNGYLRISDKYKEPLDNKITELNDDGEFKMPSFEDMKNVESDAWVHEFAYIYPNGKIINDGQETEPIERLKGINGDSGYTVKEDANEGEEGNTIDMKFWKCKVIGDNIMYPSKEDNSIMTSHAVIVIQNERWPGTYCVVKGNKFVNCYVGFAYKNVDECYYPTQLKQVDKDPEDTKEKPEPNPAKEPVIPESDTDEEKQEGEGEEQ